MKRLIMVGGIVLAVTASGLAFSDDGSGKFRESLNGFKEAAAPVSTTGTGTFNATISKDETEITYELTFENLEGNVTQAHIHIGHPQGQGGIVLWLCQTATNMNPLPGNSTPSCTVDDPLNLRAGKVTGTLTAADVAAQAPNGIAAGEWAEVLGLIRAGRTYANVHSAKFGGGEIRSQIDNGDDDHDDHGRHHDH
jgi:CHRD domain